MGINNLLKVVAQQQHGQRSNTQPLDHKSKTLTTRLPSHVPVQNNHSSFAMHQHHCSIKHCLFISVVLTVPLTATSNGCLDQAVKLLVTADGQLQMARSDTFHFQIFAGIACQLKNLPSNVITLRQQSAINHATK